MAVASPIPLEHRWYACVWHHSQPSLTACPFDDLLVCRTRAANDRICRLLCLSQVDAAILKLHSRRVCCLAVPPSSDSHMLSGDKKGGIAVWNFTQVCAMGQ